MNDVEKMNSDSDSLSSALWDEAYLKEMAVLAVKSRSKIDEATLKTQSERYKVLFESNEREVADFRFKTIKIWIEGLGGAIPDDILRDHLNRMANIRQAFDPDGLEAERVE